jgi:membrane fusion protein (multidrug efflux system)
MNRMKKTMLALLATLLLAACGEQPKSDLDKLKLELKNKKVSLDSLKGEITDLEARILEMDTTARTNTIAVMIDTISRNTYKNPFEVQGLVASDADVMVNPEVPGTVTKIHVKEGQRVYKGQVIASLDGSVAQAQIAELQERLSLAKDVYERQERLWNQKIGSEVQYLQAKNNYESLKKSIATASQQVGKYTLRSPISGTVDAIMANEGQLVGGMGGAVARIVNLSVIELKANVSETYIGTLKSGQEVEVFYPSLNKRVKEKIYAVGNTIDVNNRTFTVTLKPQNLKGELKPNLLAIITAYNYVIEDAITVPTKLVQNNGEGDFVFTAVPRGEKLIVERTPIAIAKQFASRSVIESGLTEESLLITDGYSGLVAGDEVHVVNE